MDEVAIATASHWAPILESIADAAFAIVILALAVELIAGRVAKRFERTIDAHRESEVASLNNETERLKSENLKLQQQAAIRDITPQQIEEAASKLSKFSGQPAKIVIFPVNFESNWIANEVHAILHTAKWNVDFPVQLPAPPNGFMVQGIWVDRSNDPASKSAANALREALGSTVAAASGIADGDSLLAGRSGLFDPSQPMVWIMVGDKPTPLHSWVKP